MRTSASGGAAVRPTVGLVGLGCAKNLVDGEIMLGHLRSRGIAVVADPAAADVVVINTCGFVVEAKEESIAAILDAVDAKGRGEVRRVVVSGCMAQAYAAELAGEIPEIDTFVGLDELERIVEAVGEEERHLPDQRRAVRLYDAAAPRVVSTGASAYLKVAEGCDNPCTFCHIPAMRGGFRSRRVADLVTEARALAAQGARELVLVAQDTTRYGEDLGLDHGLLRLLEALLGATDVPWLRVMYAYPATLDRELFRLMAAEPRVVPYLDIPLQHASRPVLKAMRRGGDARSYRRLIDQARETVPDLAVRSTFIVGFPGEGEEEFGELLDFLRAVELDHVGAFRYSWQEENPGSALGDPVAEEVKEQRWRRLMETQQPISAERNRRLVGRTVEALVEGPYEEMPLLTAARLRRHAPDVDGRLLINDGTAEPGELVEVELTEAHPYDLVGRIRSRILPAPERPTAPAGSFPV